LLSFQNAAPAAEGGVGGRSGRKGCRAEAAGTRTGRNAVEDPGCKPGLRAAAAAPEGSDAHAAMLLQGFAMAAHRPAEWLTVKGWAKRDLATERCNGHQLARTT
jgi:hypothetical protein